MSTSKTPSYSKSASWEHYNAYYTTMAYGHVNKSQIVENYASYQFDFKLQPFVAYNSRKGRNIGSNATVTSTPKNISISMLFTTSTKISTYL